MKKIVAMLLALVMLFSLAACGSGGATTETKQQAQTATTGKQTDEAADGNTAEVVLLVSAAGQLDDRAFNTACWAGVKDWCEANGKTYSYYQPTEDTVEAQMVVCDTAVKAGAKFIIINSDQFKLAAVEMEKTYPDVTFIMYDSVPTSADGTEVVEDNMTVILFKEQEVGYLAGYAAVVDGYTKLGYLGGMPVPAVVRFGYGFAAGVEQAAKDLNVEGVELKFGYFGNFAATPDNQALCASWYQSGTEVIFVAAGPAGASAFKAAEDNNGLVIGVDSDQSGESETIISSAMKDLKRLTMDALQQWADGTIKGGTVTSYGCAEGGVALPMDTSKWKNFTQADYDSLYARLSADENGMASTIPVDTTYDTEFIPVEDLPGITLINIQ
ncbi:MAG: BMP family ABC transporter substrate-binding protein [Candidatus Faecousia sp.]|nr:BMP family ABC transporter substrate-binding protein [Clostridiales bacterium]MDY6179915.1 BMP family ABC transporter substrate-binding protein [Candidatus Faecousia sp.]